MVRIYFIWALVLGSLAASAQSLLTPFEISEKKKSTTYKELIDFYDHLDRKCKQIKVEEAGATDAYYPLQVVYYSNDGDFDINDWKSAGKIILLINNGIHPGEPDGIDACMMLLRDAASRKITIPNNVVLAVIPVFNIGGMLNRNTTSRANQNGPEAYGFRGNSQNLDLNRDFMKQDAKETRSLIKLFHKLDPDLFIDNHVSDGADYQHVMTLLSSQHNKLGLSLGKFMNESFEPMIYADMKTKGYDLIPYVNHFGNTPEQGWTEFYEPPRFASGFAALFQTLPFVTETHMLKSFDKRVQATYDMMLTFIKLSSENAKSITAARNAGKEEITAARESVLEWRADTTKHVEILFKGYEADYKKSLVSGQPRLYYDRNRPFTRKIPFYNTYVPKQTVEVPQAYIIKRGWSKLIDRLKTNGVKMQELENDTNLALTVYYIRDYETGKKPYESHYMHSGIKVAAQTKYIKLLKGDYFVSTNQPSRRYITEALEPTAPDGFFAWGFTDGILQQKEYFSDYVFEDEAAELLTGKSELRMQLSEKQKADAAFAQNGEAQLDFVYKHSDYYEPTHNLYPVFRLE